MVTSCVHNQKFAWTDNVMHSALASGEHILILEKIGENKTILKHDEVFSGLFAPVVMFFAKQSTVEGFELMNEALKAK
jgi:hypothetical protein